MERDGISRWHRVLSARMRRRRAEYASAADVVLLDTALGSENSGDQIIMQACDSVCFSLWGGVGLKRIPTHYYVEESERLADKVKILCGTNIIWKNMEEQVQWALPNDLHSYQNVCLLGTGLSDVGIEQESSLYTKLLYHTLLSQNMLHSVRDERAKQYLNSIGFNNVVNTACPTMWSLTSELLSQIPKKKGRRVLTSITDYCFSPEEDLEMLKILQQEYEHVTIWVQGSHDIDWCLSQIVDLNEFELIGPSIRDLDAVLADPDLDYVGTRLHAGIRCLNKAHRTLVITVDNRARQIGADTNLPVLERSKIHSGALEQWINSPQETHIDLPLDAIEEWKSQFSLSKNS